jgi:hypothetical protein
VSTRHSIACADAQTWIACALDAPLLNRGGVQTPARWRACSMATEVQQLVCGRMLLAEYWPDESVAGHYVVSWPMVPGGDVTAVDEQHARALAVNGAYGCLGAFGACGFPRIDGDDARVPAEVRA